MARQSKLFKADGIERTVRDTVEERDSGYARLHNYAGSGNKVEMFWRMNPEAEADHMLKLKVECRCGSSKCRGAEIVVWKEEFQRFLRWV